MKKSLLKLGLAALMFAAFETNAYGKDVVSVSTESNRAGREFGIIASTLGDPLSLASLSVGRHVTDWMRVVSGIGFTPLSQSAISLGGGVKFMVPTWNLTPVIGANVAYMMLLNAGGGSGFISYENLGLEYTADNGFHIGAGVNGLFVVSGSTTLADRLSPYLNIGVFF